MKISELISSLEDAKALLGDVEVKVEDFLLGDYYPVSVARVEIGCFKNVKHVDLVKSSIYRDIIKGKS